jgi:phosphate starvation-inducible PhoH-like protein
MDCAKSGIWYLASEVSKRKLLSEIILTVEGIDPVELYGENNVKLNLLRKAFPELTITSRGNSLKLSGEKQSTQKAKSKFETMVRLLKENKELPTQVVEDLLGGNNPFEGRLTNGESGKVLVFGPDGKQIRAKTRNQKRLIEQSERNDLVFAIGPAGSGKTYTAVALAVRALKNKWVKKIILTRPAVEAGESLGFLPGDLKEKIDPYLRPLYDALDDMIPQEKLQQFMTTNVIEIAPLAFMRGRTLDNAFIILDEAQNCSTMQLKMFLTRLGPSAKCIVTGDLSQIDLPFSQKSGLRRAINLLGHLDGISTVYLDAEDIVRHRLVKEIVKAYERSDAELRRLRDIENEEMGPLPPSANQPEPEDDDDAAYFQSKNGYEYQEEE